MNRGDVWWVNFDPALGGEIRKHRPAVILSNDFANKHLNRVQVVPLTSQVGKLYPSAATETNRVQMRVPTVSRSLKEKMKCKKETPLGISFFDSILDITLVIRHNCYNRERIDRRCPLFTHILN